VDLPGRVLGPAQDGIYRLGRRYHIITLLHYAIIALFCVITLLRYYFIFLLHYITISLYHMII
jgi:hypothetical protein